MLMPGKNQLAPEFQTQMYGGNELWADSQAAQAAGAEVARALIERHGRGPEDIFPAVRKEAAAAILGDALEVVNYAALPTERRANILHGVIDTLAQTGILGGEPEWAFENPDSDQGVEK